MHKQHLQQSGLMFALVLSLLGLGLVSCTSTPPAEERAPRQATDGPAVAPEESPEAAGLSPVLFNKASPGAPGVGTLPATDRAPWTEDSTLEPRAASMERGVPETEAGPDADAEDLSYASLVAIVASRLDDDWRSITGGIGQHETPAERDARRSHVAGRIVAASFLAEAPPARDGALAEALRASQTEGSAPEYRLLAAACLLRAGASDEAWALVRSVADEEPSSTSPPESTTAAEGEFRLANLAFAKSIDGLGKFIPAAREDLVPGNAILIYGEFHDGASFLEEGSNGEGDRYRRSFSASLAIVSAEGEEIDTLDFLPESRGSQTSEGPTEPVNFWARYTIPSDLAPGPYRVRIRGTDVLGDSEASAEIPLVVRSATRKAGARS